MEITDLKEVKYPCVLKFGAEWCKPCKRMKPAYDDLAERFKGKVAFYTVDVDECEKCDSSLPEDFQVDGVPKLVLLKNKNGSEDFGNMLDNLERRLFQLL